jgi:hypothetical protein
MSVHESGSAVACRCVVVLVSAMAEERGLTVDEATEAQNTASHSATATAQGIEGEVHEVHHVK